MTEIKKNYDFAKKVLFPICRSITGNGINKTLALIKKKSKYLKIKKIKSNKKVFDWVVPPEWNIHDAYVEDCFGNKIISYKINNLHIVNFSMAVNKFVTKKELFKHLHYIKEIPNAIPYVTSYYKRNWGFCVTYNQYKKIKKNYKDREYFRVFIDSKHNSKGSLRYGELVLKGKSKKEILVSTYICHPSMANNELSGPIVSMSLINYFSKKKLSRSIRFLFIPETIGSITYIHKNYLRLKKNCIGGFNLTCIGDEKNHSCMFSKYKNSPSDFALIDAYKQLKINYKTYSFLERGSDERQFNSPGVDLGITSIFRSKYKEYREYHNSLDDFKFVTLNGIKGGFKVAKKSIEILLNSKIPKSKVICEPKLSKINLYSHISKQSYKSNKMNLSKKLLNFLQYSDGKNRLEEISKYINLSFVETKKIFKILKTKKLIDEI